MPSSRRLLGGAVRLFTAVAVGYFALWACAPPSVLAPPVPMADGQHWEIGGTAIGGLAQGSPQRVAGAVAPTAGGNTWGMAHVGKWDLGGTAFLLVSSGGTAGTGGGGVFARWRGLETDTFVLAPELSTGLIWSGMALPMAYKVAPAAWLYTAPALSLGADNNSLDFHIPLGASFTLNEHLQLHTEAGLQQLGYVEFTSYYVGLGVGFRP